MPKKSKIRQPDMKSNSLIKSPVATKISTDNLRPIFSLQYIEKAYCITRCEKEEKAAFADTLHKLSQFTWGELKQADRHGVGYEKINRQSIKASLPTHLTDDVDFIAFRFYTKAPMVGYREDDTFHIIWLDRQFSLYRHS